MEPFAAGRTPGRRSTQLSGARFPSGCNRPQSGPDEVLGPCHHFQVDGRSKPVPVALVVLIVALTPLVLAMGLAAVCRVQDNDQAPKEERPKEPEPAPAVDPILAEAGYKSEAEFQLALRKELCTPDMAEAGKLVVKDYRTKTVVVDPAIFPLLDLEARERFSLWAATCEVKSDYMEIVDGHTGKRIAKWGSRLGYRPD